MSRVVRMFRRRRGQIRGIDFAMAMTIFVLVMSQVLILTTTLIQTTSQETRNEVFVSEVDASSGAIVSSTGSPANWETIATGSLPSTWSLGLKQSNGNGVSAAKIGRLNPSNTPNFGLTYNDILAGINESLPGYAFQLSIEYKINITILNIATVGSNLNISGIVTKDGFGLNASEIWVNGVSTSGVVTAQTTTLSDGSFSTLLVYGGLPNYAEIVAIARYGRAIEAYDNARYVGTGTITDASMTLQETDSTGAPYQLDITVSGSDTDYDYYVLFGNPSQSSTATSTSDTTTGGVTTSLNIPEHGLAVVVAIGRNVQETGVAGFPVAIDDQHSSTIAPSSIPVDDSVISTQQIFSRGIVLELKIKVWR